MKKRPSPSLSRSWSFFYRSTASNTQFRERNGFRSFTKRRAGRSDVKIRISFSFYHRPKRRMQLRRYGISARAQCAGHPSGAHRESLGRAPGRCLLMGALRSSVALQALKSDTRLYISASNRIFSQQGRLVPARGDVRVKRGAPSTPTPSASSPAQPTIPRSKPRRANRRSLPSTLLARSGYPTLSAARPWPRSCSERL